MNPFRIPPGLLARTLCRAALALPLMLGAAAAHATSIAEVATSSGGSWGGIGNSTWTPTAAGSVVSAAEVNGKLVAASVVKVLTHTADPALAVKAALTLGATSQLELRSHGDIAIKAPVQAAGASLMMRYGQRSTTAGNTADIAATAPVHLNASSTYTAQLGSDGVDIRHTIITGLGIQGSNTGTDLQGMQGDLAGHYVLGADIDASATAAWNGGKGFNPVGIGGAMFTGSLDGLGHTIASLSIKLPTLNAVGMFFGVQGSVLRNIGLLDTHIEGQSLVGALAGIASGSAIRNSYVKGNLNATNSLGGMVGGCDSCSISGSYAEGNINASVRTGGLLGNCVGGTCAIHSSYSMGKVSAAASFAGGLAGDCTFNCSIDSSYATGEVSVGTSYAGGLVGYCSSICSFNTSYSTGHVSVGTAYAGGLVGSCSNCTINSSFYAVTDAGGSSINNGGAQSFPSQGNMFGTAATLDQLKSLSIFTAASWDIDDEGGTGKAWRIYDGKTTPLLRSLFTDSLTITANSGSKTVDGTATALGVAYTPATPDARLLGTPVAEAASSAVGTQTVTVTGVHSTQHGYDITLVPGTLTINAVLVAPDAPAAPAAAPGNAQATVTWAAPSSDGGSPISSYTVTGTPGGTCTVAAAAPRICTIALLTNGTPYTFKVRATNAIGDSPLSIASTPVTPTVPVVVAPPAEDPGPSATPIDGSGTTTITNASLPVVVGPGASGGTIVLPGTGTTPVTLQVTINGQPLTVQALPGTQLRIAQVDGQNVLVLVVLQGWASMTSTAVGQPMVLAGPVLLRAGQAGTRVEAIPLAVAVRAGSLLPPPGQDAATRASAGLLPQVGSMGLQAGERLQVNDQGAVVSVTLGSLQGDASQPGDPMVFSNLPASITVDKAFARLAGPLARLSGASMAQGLEAAPSGVFLVRDGGQIFQLLPTLPITIDATLPDGLAFTPLGLLRWVRGGVVVQFAPAVADLAGLANAITTALPDATIQLGAEGVLQLHTGGQIYVLKPDWTGSGTAPGTPQIGVDGEGRIYLQTGQSARQTLLPSLLNASQTSSIVTTALPGAVLAVQVGSDTGAFTLTQAGRAWRLTPQWLLPTGGATQVPPHAGPWWVGADGLLYLKVGTHVQAVHISPW